MGYDVTVDTLQPIVDEWTAAEEVLEKAGKKLRGSDTLLLTFGWPDLDDLVRLYNQRCLDLGRIAGNTADGINSDTHATVTLDKRYHEADDVGKDLFKGISPETVLTGDGTPPPFIPGPGGRMMPN